MYWKRILLFLKLHIRLISYLAGSLFVGLWTLLRFFTTASTFDLVGQQLLTRQWLAGHSTHAVVGTTNYLWKMLLFYTPLDLAPGSPRFKLIVLTLIINIITFILLVIIIEKILRELRFKVTNIYFLALIWFSLISGSIYWIQFTNSRNLEVVGGALLILLSLKLNSKFSWKLATGTAAFAALLFFSDPIQIYMLALPLLCYTLIQSWRLRSNWLPFSRLIVILIIAFIASKLLKEISSHIFHLSYPQGPSLAKVGSYSITHWISDSLKTAKSYVQLYEGGHELGKVSQIINLLVIAISAVYFMLAAVKKKKVYLNIVSLLLAVVLIDAIVYLFSGQAFISGTSRYLIMTVPIMLIMLGSLSIKSAKAALYIMLIAIVVSGSLLISNTASAWGNRFSKDQHLASTVSFLRDNRYPYAFASMDTAIPASYFYNPHTPILPLNCSNQKLAKNYLFYDKSVFTLAEAKPSNLVPIFLDGNSIRNSHNICTEVAITTQLGQPKSVQQTNHGDLVLIYTPTALQRLN